MIGCLRTLSASNQSLRFILSLRMSSSFITSRSGHKPSTRPHHIASFIEVRKRAKIRNRYNQAPHLTQDTNGKVTTSQLDITKERQELSPFPAGDHKASINRRTRKHNKNKTELAWKISQCRKCKCKLLK